MANNVRDAWGRGNMLAYKVVLAEGRRVCQKRVFHMSEIFRYRSRV